MAYLLKYLYNMMDNLFKEHADPRVQHLPLVGSPLPVACVLTAYLSFVLHYGPKWMAERKPYSLKHVMRFYNAIQVIANLLLFLFGIPHSYMRKEFSLTCQPIDHSNTTIWMQRLILVSYGYYITKYLDLFDTIFFILRKKNNQITFLHVYHHAGMVFGVYVFMTFLAGSHSTMLGLINLFIHTVMYSYYFVTSLRPIQANYWWKRHITQLQLLQFGYLMLHFLMVIVRNECQHPIIIAFVGLIQNLFMFALFFDFYYKAYIRKQAQPVATAADRQAATSVTDTDIAALKQEACNNIASSNSSINCRSGSSSSSATAKANANTYNSANSNIQVNNWSRLTTLPAAKATKCS